MEPPPLSPSPGSCTPPRHEVPRCWGLSKGLQRPPCWPPAHLWPPQRPQAHKPCFQDASAKRTPAPRLRSSRRSPAPTSDRQTARSWGCTVALLGKEASGGGGQRLSDSRRKSGPAGCPAEAAASAGVPPQPPARLPILPSLSSLSGVFRLLLILLTPARRGRPGPRVCPELVGTSRPLPGAHGCPRTRPAHSHPPPSWGLRLATWLPPPFLPAPPTPGRTAAHLAQPRGRPTHIGFLRPPPHFRRHADP